MGGGITELPGEDDDEDDDHVPRRMTKSDADIHEYGHVYVDVVDVVSDDDVESCGGADVLFMFFLFLREGGWGMGMCSCCHIVTYLLVQYRHSRVVCGTPNLKGDVIHIK